MPVAARHYLAHWPRHGGLTPFPGSISPRRQARIVIPQAPAEQNRTDFLIPLALPALSQIRFVVCEASATPKQAWSALCEASPGLPRVVAVISNYLHAREALNCHFG